MPNNLADLIFTDEQKKALLANIQFVRQLSQQKITDQLENWIINNFESVIGYFPHIGYSTTFYAFVGLQYATTIPINDSDQ